MQRERARRWCNRGGKKAGSLGRCLVLQVDYVAMLAALKESCQELGIQDVKPFVDKVGEP